MRPFVGLPQNGRGCAYGGPSIDSGGCDQSPSLHVAVFSDGWGVVGLSTCDLHADIAKAAGDHLADHPYRPECETTNCWAPELQTSRPAEEL